jgi:VanZ family protein
MDSKWVKYFWGTTFFGWAIVLFIISVMPSTGLKAEGSKDGDFRWDYPLHFIVFMIFAILYGYWRKNVKVSHIKKEITWFLFAGSLYAGLTESVQLFVAGRSFNPVDMLLNVLGVLTGTLLAYLFIFKPNAENQKLKP